MKYAFWLSNVPGMTGRKIHRLLECCTTAKEIYGLPESQLFQIEGITQLEAESLVESRRNWNLDKNWNNLWEQGISFVSIEQKEYPQRLRNILNPPYSLYYRGKLPDPDKKSVAIVGARGRSQYGSQAASRLAGELAKNKIEVISGLARGIDADAHSGALEADGGTYAVLGCGADICYPRQNRYLYDKICETGGIISEYPIKSAALAWHFPERNRIISGLSDVVVVVEARKKSGSLITADYAMEQGKDVFALPGRIFDPLSEGCNLLISQGAGIISNISEFVCQLVDTGDFLFQQIDFKKNLLEKDELLVYSLLDFAPTGIGTLIEKSGLSLMELLAVLERTEQKGFIKEMIPNYYVRCI